MHTSHDADGERSALLGRRISELGLRLQGTPLERLVEQLYSELRAHGLVFLPPVYLSDEWGCPESTPVIAAPFYLADTRLMRIEEERAAGVESEDESMRYLRHEAGHAYNYAYRLYDRPEWRRLFGPYSRPYHERYHADPFSRRHVRHILGAADNDWRAQYAGWPALAKLEYVDVVMHQIAEEPPVVSAEVSTQDLPVDAMHYTVEEHYRELEHQLPIEDPQFFDGDLLTIFVRAKSDQGVEANKFLVAHRRELVARVGYWSGEGPSVVGAFVDFLTQRVRQLQLVLRHGEASTLIELTAFGTAVMMNYRYTDTMGRHLEESA